MIIRADAVQIATFSPESQVWMNRIALGNSVVRFLPGDEADGQ